MSDQPVQWEYRVQTIGSAFGTKDEDIEATLNEWGLEGWEVSQVYTPSQSNNARRAHQAPSRQIDDTSRRWSPWWPNGS
jgi:hypothetical protein